MRGLGSGQFGIGFGQGSGRGVRTSIFRINNRFTARHEEGTLIISLTGTTAESKSNLSEITIQDGQVVKNYKSLDKVPERYRDKVKNLLEMTEKGSVKVEVPTP